MRVRNSLQSLHLALLARRACQFTISSHRSTPRRAMSIQHSRLWSLGNVDTTCIVIPSVERERKNNPGRRQVLLSGSAGANSAENMSEMFSERPFFSFLFPLIIIGRASIYIEGISTS